MMYFWLQPTSTTACNWYWEEGLWQTTNYYGSYWGQARNQEFVIGG